ncbi:dihydrofolate reductase family protein [Pseudonocardia spinosispora]|uniref:dihydrofolate reductase family protein n=1 Tax=Pseudonocardia spinosispora TaxID=103441 RepID=UPI0003FE3494|nr:dihydrofolate reductase family protein [Pseudonocardia spinosispora]
MGRIIISENITLDGVAADPTGEEGVAGGGWFDQISAPDREAWAELEYEEAVEADALLLGRHSDSWFAERWLTRQGEWADRLNGLPKYVVSSTRTEPAWSSSTPPHGRVLGNDVVDEVSRLRRELAGTIVVYASIRLVRTLLEHDLVDELRLVVFPIVLGTGEGLFDGVSTATDLRLVETRGVGDGLVLLIYRPCTT